MYKTTHILKTNRLKKKILKFITYGNKRTTVL